MPPIQGVVLRDNALNPDDGIELEQGERGRGIFQVHIAGPDLGDEVLR
jgi:hypothetical protein